MRVCVCTCMFTSATPAAENVVPELDDASLFQSQSSNVHAQRVAQWNRLQLLSDLIHVRTRRGRTGGNNVRSEAIVLLNAHMLLPHVKIRGLPSSGRFMMSHLLTVSHLSGGIIFPLSSSSRPPEHRRQEVDTVVGDGRAVSDPAYNKTCRSAAQIQNLDPD